MGTRSWVTGLSVQAATAQGAGGLQLPPLFPDTCSAGKGSSDVAQSLRGKALPHLRQPRPEPGPSRSASLPHHPGPGWRAASSPDAL